MKIKGEQLALYGCGNNNYYTVPEKIEFLVISAYKNKLKVVYEDKKIYTLVFTNDEIIQHFMHFYFYWHGNNLKFLEGKIIKMKLKEVFVSSDYEEDFFYGIDEVTCLSYLKNGIPLNNYNEMIFNKPIKLRTRIMGYQYVSGTKIKVYFKYNDKTMLTDIMSMKKLKEMTGKKFAYNPLNVLYNPVTVETGIYKYYLNGKIAKSDVHITSLEFEERDEEGNKLNGRNTNY